MTTSMATRRGPRLGSKQIFLPNFTLTLLRTPDLPPSFASFIVPLNLNKLDLRDYLFNCYGVSVLGVRSYIQQQKVRQDKPGAKRPSPRKWYRPRAIKKMLVELERPFVWPEEPKNLDAWDKATHDAAQKWQEDSRAEISPTAREKPTKERASIAEQAKAILAGKERWKLSADTETLWEDVGEAVEVEQGVTLPRE